MTSRAIRTTKAKTTTATTSAWDELRRKLLVVACTVAAVALSAPAAAGASDARLRTTLANWSHRIALDAHGIGVSASLRHPRRMTRRARQFRADSVRARRALAPVRPTSVRGRRAKQLALAAFRDYAIVGRQWVLSGQARVRGLKLAAGRHARLAGRYARRGNRLLLAAGRLLR
jgi:hypothetical protein